jgi:hypothetical protein
MKQNFYEPLVQGEAQPTQVRGFRTEIAGTYVLLDDVVTVIRQYAQSLEDPNEGALVHEVANWLVSGEQLPAPKPEPVEIAHVEAEIYGAESDDVTPDVDRVEIFPVETARGRKWHARTIDTGGNVMKVAHGNYDRAWVERNAEERWPGIPMYEVADENERSMWKERGERGHKHGLYPTVAR